VIVRCDPALVNSCPYCEAPLRPAATFCLACDRPVVDESSRLSVADSVQVTVGRPLVGLLVMAACVLAIGATAYGGYALVHHEHVATTSQAVRDVTRGTTLLVEAEAGHTGACRKAETVLAGPAAQVHSECLSLVDDDPGAHAGRMKVDGLSLHGTVGTAHVRAAITDDAGTHTLDRKVDLSKVGRDWRMTWDGKAV
jgi:hypothetical protein